MSTETARVVGIGIVGRSAAGDWAAGARGMRDAGIHPDSTLGKRSASTSADTVRRHRFLASVGHTAHVE